MLGLAASDLAILHPTESLALSTTALHHRVTAIKSLNAALALGVRDMEQSNAMLATCFTLVFQSALLSDGFPEFMSFIRGCMVVGYQMGAKRIKFIFEGMEPGEQLNKMGPHLLGKPDTPPEQTQAAIDSLKKCEHLVKLPMEKAFWAGCMKIAEGSGRSSREAYMGIQEIYGTFAYAMSSQEFAWLVNPDNKVGLLLQAHLIAIQTIIDSVLSKEEEPNPKAEDPNRPRHIGTVGWLTHVQSQIPPETAEYFEWPMQRLQELKAECEAKMRMAAEEKKRITETNLFLGTDDNGDVSVMF
jgi:hypothetical protein